MEGLRTTVPHRPAARLLAAWVALVIATLTGPLASSARAAAIPATTAAVRSTMSLIYQQPWVESSAGLRLRLGIDSPLPASRLGLKVVLYSETTTRDAFEATLGGAEPASEVPIDSVPAGGTIPLAGIDHGGKVDLHLPVDTGNSSSGSTTSPVLSLDCTTYCPGVYPLEFVLFDTELGTQLASLTTYLVYAPPQTGALKLDVATVLPLGYQPALGASGASLLGARRLNALTAMGNVLDAFAPGTLSVAVHGQLLAALARDHRPAARGVVVRLAHALGGTTPSEQLVAAPFSAIDPTALAHAGLGAEVATQLGVSRRVDSSTLGLEPPPSPAVVATPLGPAGLQALATAGAHELVVPAASLAGPAPATTTVTPYRLIPGSPDAGSVVFAADTGLGARFDDTTSDAALAAEQLLAELAVVYFEQPFLSTRRAVVIAPSTDGPNASFLREVGAGLRDSPLLNGVDLDTLFELYRNDPHLPGAHLTNEEPTGGPSATAVKAARSELAALERIVPGSPALTIPVEESVLVGESARFDSSRRAAYFGAPAHALGLVARSLSLGGIHTITLTARSGSVPITVSSQYHYPLDLVMHVRSTDLTFPGGTRFAIHLAGPHPFQTVRIPVRTLTSGVTTLQVTLRGPNGAPVLEEGRLSIRSTALSGVAVALSIGALAVLAIWWARSVRRRRRAGRSHAPSDLAAT